MLVWSGVQASAFILGPKMRLRLLLVVMVIALVLTRSRMGNAAFFAAMLIVGSIAIVLARKTAPKTIALIASLLGLGLLGALVALTLWTVLAVLARRRSRLPRGMAFGVAMSIVALLIHSAVDFNLQIPANALTIVVILAVGWVTHSLPSPASRRKSSSGKRSINPS